MQTLGMNLSDTLTPVTKKNFQKWHSEGCLLLLNAGNGVLDIVLSRLNDTGIHWRDEGKQTTIATINGANNSIYMFSNGCEEFVIVVDDMQGSAYSKDFHKRTGKQHLTIYVVND